MNMISVNKIENIIWNNHFWLYSFFAVSPRLLQSEREERVDEEDDTVRDGTPGFVHTVFRLVTFAEDTVAVEGVVGDNTGAQK